MRRFALALLAAAALGACTSPSPSPSPSRSDDAPIASAPPAATDGDPGQVPLFVPGDALALTVGPVDVFLDADGSSQHMGSLMAGDVVRVIGYAKVDGGRVWLYVLDLSSPVRGRLPDLPEMLPEPEFGLTGWILATDATGSRVRFLQPRCPQRVDFETVSAMLGFERLACFGRLSLTLDGIAGCGPCGGGEGVYEPPWLAGDAGGSMFAPSGPGRLSLYLPPPFAFPESGTLIRVRGHFDDPAAATCSATIDGLQMPRAETIERCRRSFVVESIEVLPKPPPDPLE